MKRTVLMSVLLLQGAALLPAQPLHPPQPTNLVAQSPPIIPLRIMLSWNAPNGMWFFKVYRSVGDSLNFRWIGASPSRTFEDSDILPATTYYYSVTSFVFQDTVIVESARSNVAAITTANAPQGPRGTVAGTVTEDGTGLPIPSIRIRCFKLSSTLHLVYGAITDSLGRYAVSADTGTYFVRVDQLLMTPQQPQYGPEWYNNASGPETATPVTVVAADTARIDFALTRGNIPKYAYINGTVTDTLGTPLAGASVTIMRSIQQMNSLAATTGTTPGAGPEAVVIPGIGYTRGVIWTGFTNAAGQYHAQVFNPGDYIAAASKQGYRPEMFDNTSDPTRATIIVIHGDTSGIDFTLAPVTPTVNSIEGTVEDSVGLAAPGRVILFPRPRTTPDEDPLFTHTDEFGTFAVADVDPGSYYILAAPFSDYAPAFFRSGSPGVTHWQDADSVNAVGVVTGINIRVPALASTGLARVTGTITSSNSLPLPGTGLVVSGNHGAIGVALTDGQGTYSIEALLSGPLGFTVSRFGYSKVQETVTIPSNVYSLGNVNFVLTSAYPSEVEAELALPQHSQLHQNFPNPFNPTTTIRYTVGGVVAPSGAFSSGVEGPDGGHVRLVVHDILGREVGVLVNQRKPAGSYTVRFDASNLATGVYLYRMQAGNYVATMKMVVLK